MQLKTFEIPPRIVTGWGSVGKLGDEALQLGKRVLIICSRRLKTSGLISDLFDKFEQAGEFAIVHEAQPGEPTIQETERVLQLAERHGIDVVVAIGGGSVLDLGKAVAGLCHPDRLPVRDYFYGKQPSGSGIPWVAVPTTSGSGAEATPNAVLSDEKHLKQSIRGDRRWLADIVILDPELTVHCPPNITAWSGMDALTQAIESYTAKGASELTEPYSLRSAVLLADSLLAAYEQPDNREARTKAAYGSLLAGMALANARLGIVHGVAHPVGLHYGIPHGLVCGILLPWAIRFNRPVCEDKYARLAKAMGIGKSADDLIAWIEQLKEKMEIPASLSKFGIKREDFPRIVRESMPSGSLKANPRHVTEEDLMAFLEEQLG